MQKILLTSTVVYLITGLVSGLLAGLLGVGGGLVIVPALIAVFSFSGLPGNLVVHVAIATSLAVIIPTALSSIKAHHSHGAVRWSLVRLWLPGLVAGGAFGAWLARAVDAEALRMVFGLFEIAVALQILSGMRPRAHRGLPGWFGSGVMAALIGSVSSLLGIGGGTLSVPALLWCGVPIRSAIATSAAFGFPIALAGALSFMMAGEGVANLPPGMVGLVYLPAFFVIALASVLAAPVGARLAHTLPVAVLRKIFAGFLLLVGARLVL